MNFYMYTENKAGIRMSFFFVQVIESSEMNDPSQLVMKSIENVVSLL